jgi:glycosyltransferase involved in cell wall biosynthesis
MPKLLIISQVYPPDPAAVGQQLADVAEEMVRRGWQVKVWTAARGYEDPSLRYPRRELRAGVQVSRLPWSSFGKGSIAVRLVAQVLFMAQALLRALVTPGATAILVSTSPPFAGFGGCLVSWLRRVPLVWWVMDINPDQMVASGRLSARSLVARMFDWMNLHTLRQSRDVIVLDRFMRDRILQKAPVGTKLHVVPPWPHDNVLNDIPHDANPFRRRHELADSFVVMYSGNHGYSTPLDTLLAAAKRLRQEPRLKFVFIGGGVVKKEIDAMVAREAPPNILALPYQPLADIRFSLSAADVHVVSIANEGVGIVHPCKVYGALAIGRPVIALAPAASYAADILGQHHVGWLVEHGEVDRFTALLRELLAMPRAELAAMGQAAKEAVRECYSRDRLLASVCDIVEGISTGDKRVAEERRNAGHSRQPA